MQRSVPCEYLHSCSRRLTDDDFRSLWETYTVTSTALEPHLMFHPTVIAALSGAAAGGMQALVAAPVENVRLILEGGSGTGWSGAWKEVFRGTIPASPESTPRENARQVREWMNEVKGMAGRGWNGWIWGCTKDIFGKPQLACVSNFLVNCIPGFATFFAIFDITRRTANFTKTTSQNALDSFTYGEDSRMQTLRRHFPRTVHGTTLVSGGVIAGLAYEIISRPFDVARKTAQENKLLHGESRDFAMIAIKNKVKQDGFLAFFRNPSLAENVSVSGNPRKRRLQAAVRTLARVGPWGIGFLVWEAFGPGLS